MTRKNILKTIGIIAVAAVIGFSMTACDMPTDDGVPKTIVITGLTAKSGVVNALALYELDEKTQGGYGSASVVGGQVTLKLLNLKKPGENFTFADDFYITLDFVSDSTSYAWAGSVGGNLAMKYYISQKTETIPFDEFMLLN